MGQGWSAAASTTAGWSAKAPSRLGCWPGASSASGLLGVTFSPDDGSHGVFGSSTVGGNGVTGFVGSATGAIGSSVRGIGVRGTTGTGEAGVLGETFGDGSSGGAGPAVLGSSDDGVGVSGVSGSTDATEGLTFGNGYGHYSLHFSAQPGGGVLGVSVLGSGVEGFTFARAGTTPMWPPCVARAPTGSPGCSWAGSASPVSCRRPVAGSPWTIRADPENKYLSHSFVESPEMLNVYSGTVTTNRDGVARVRLPAYFEALNRDFRYQLTVIGEFARAMVSEEIKDNEFAIRTDPGRVKVCWQVTGVRKDAWAEANRIPVEETKPKAERGRYLHPELFGKKAGADPPGTGHPGARCGAGEAARSGREDAVRPGRGRRGRQGSARAARPGQTIVRRAGRGRPQPPAAGVARAAGRPGSDAGDGTEEGQAPAAVGPVRASRQPARRRPPSSSAR